MHNFNSALKFGFSICKRVDSFLVNALINHVKQKNCDFLRIMNYEVRRMQRNRGDRDYELMIPEGFEASRKEWLQVAELSV